MDVDLRILSLGAGVQSSTLYRMAALGKFGFKVDYAIFADTQSEPHWVYETLDILERDHGHIIPIIRATRGSLRQDLEDGVNSTGQNFSVVPFWTEGKGGRHVPGRRQCTREYKIDVVAKATRELLGLKKGERAAGRFRVEELVGISLDEATRAKPSRYSWVTTRWPLLYDTPMRRADCFSWLTAHGFPIPKKSACTFCPYRGPAEYGRMRRDDPEVFEQACEVDDMIRSTGAGNARGTKRNQYVSTLLIPLRDLPPLEELEDQTLDLFENECEGMCGV